MAFKGRVFPLLAFLTGFGSIIWTYYVAVSKSPPDVKPFPWTDITHTGIHFPEYIILRIGLLVTAPLFTITFQLLKYLLHNLETIWKSRALRSSASKRLRSTTLESFQQSLVYYSVCRLQPFQMGVI